MTLVACKECGENISHRAKSCPNCGAPNKMGAGIISKLFYTFAAVIVILFLIGYISDLMPSSIEKEQLASLSKIENPVIEYEVLRKWNILNKGIGMELLVSEKSTKNDVMALARQLNSTYRSSRLLVIQIFDSREVHRHRDDEDYPNNLYFKHFLANVFRNKNNGIDEIRWVAKGRDY